MASIKNLKKDLNYLTNEIIETSFMHYHLEANKEKVKEKVDKILEESISLRNELINKVNNPPAELKGSALKKYYAEIMGQMLEKVNTSFEELDKEE